MAKHTINKATLGELESSEHPDFWSHIANALAARSSQSLLRTLTIAEPISPTLVRVNGSDAINFGANDYLGLAWHPALRNAIAEANRSLPKLGSGASPLVTGQTFLHDHLVRSIANFKDAESAIVFSSGYAANLGTVAALASKDDIIFSDSLNHASLIDGCRLSRAQIMVYPHCDPVALSELVRRNRHRGRFAFVATDSVFSMDGDVAPLVAINTLCHEYDMQCILDEAHATGVYGHHGRGLSEHLAISNSRIISIGTLSKALGCAGGYVAGPKVLIDWLSNFARSWVYSTASTIPNVAAAIQAIALVQTMSDDRMQLAKTAVDLRVRLKGLGLEVGSGDSPIIPIYLQDAAMVMNVSRRLLAAGIYVPGIRPPTVPENRSLLRVSLSVLHSLEDTTRLVNALAASNHV